MLAGPFLLSLSSYAYKALDLTSDLQPVSVLPEHKNPYFNISVWCFADGREALQECWYLAAERLNGLATRTRLYSQKEMTFC